LAKRQGQKKRELRSLNQTLSSVHGQSREFSTFDDAFFRYLHERNFKLIAFFAQYAEALSTFEDIRKLPNSEALQNTLLSYVESVNSIISSENKIIVKASIAKRGHHFHQLSRNAFGFLNVQDQFDTVEVRCEAKREKYTVAEAHTWIISPPWGQCRVFVSGEPGITFDLVEVHSA
jgi:hypothetical protein